MGDKVMSFLEGLIFPHRKIILILFMVATVFMVWSAAQLRVDAGFTKLLPLKHSYMQTFVKHRAEFGGANRVLIALMVEEGDIFTPEFFETLEAATNEVFFIPGVNRPGVRSLFTPNVRFVEIIEGGFAGGNVIPNDFRPDKAGFEQVRANIVKSGQIGRLVTEDFTGALISAELMEFHPDTGEKLDYQAVAAELEEKLREKYERDNLSVHIIGFVKVMGDIADGARSVIGFFGIALLITAILLYLYSHSWKLTVLPLVCSVIAVIWQLGAVTLLGFGLDPMNMLVPFLVFAIGISHGMQMIHTWSMATIFGTRSGGVQAGETGDDKPVDSLEAARFTFRRLLVPGSIALISDTIGFLTILLIPIRMIQELAIIASLGVTVIIFTNLVLLPILLSYIRVKNLEAYKQRRMKEEWRWATFWTRLTRVTDTGPALAIVGFSIVLFVAGMWKMQELPIGDLHAGVPELHQDSRYNIDTAVIAENFAIGVDIITVIAETVTDACIDYEIMNTIDEFAWHMANVEGVQSAITLPAIFKILNAGWNEGNPRWRVLPRNPATLAQYVTSIDTSTGLRNESCDAMPVLIFTEDHKAHTIERIVNAAKDFEASHGHDDVSFKLATGNVGVMAATNEEVARVQLPMLAYVYTAVIVLVLIAFRSVSATLSIVLPLALVSVLAYALMATLEIGLKVNTLPVVALGVGVGVDYGIYIYSRMARGQAAGVSLAYYNALQQTGKPVLFTAIALGIGVSTWLFSDLKFQADMGILLTFMFLMNMIGA
ncbi:MAG: RND family transporter, partial [Gammaproteobacteria bacterium]